MVVTAWINLQYYASAVAPERFGSGNKALHNVTSQRGCVSGNGGDLQVGLSEQSVRFQGKYVHEPMRLQVIVRASKKLDRVIEKHQMVKDLVDNGWVQLIALDPIERSDWLRDHGD